MTERENFLRTLNFDNPEWMPHGMYSMEMIMPNNVLLERPNITEGRGLDGFGVCWHLINDPENPVVNGFSYVPGMELLDDITQWREKVKLPDTSKFDWSLADQAAAQLDRENKVSLLFWESGPFERIVSFMGFEEALIAMMTEPEAFHELMDYLTDYKISLLPKIKEHYNPDMICILEDVAHHRAPFMSNDTYREMIFPHEKRLADAIRAQGIMYVYHSCGNITPILKEIIKLEPKAVLGGFAQSNDQILMEELYGNRTCFIGPINTNIMSDPNSTPEQVIGEVRRLIDTFKPYKNVIFDPAGCQPAFYKIATDEYHSYAKDIYKNT